MRLVFIYGMPATGKLTVAKELVDITGYALFHNHPVEAAREIELRLELISKTG